MENKYKNLIKLLNLFNNKPWMLAKYLIDNMALRDDFIKNLTNNKNLTELSTEFENDFKSIEEMNSFYQSLHDNDDIENNNELFNRLSELINKENYEEAAVLRDYIKRKKIKKRK